MNCYNHESDSAVGICKHCNKALCQNCLTDTGDGIACTETCVDMVNAINELIDRKRRAVSAQRRTPYLSVAFCAVMGAIFLIFGTSGIKNGTFPVAMGIGLLIYAGLNAIKIRKWLSNNDTEADQL